ncbi:MAG: hypothetical protein AAGF11_55015 [Myxococcota bacterium]
MDPQQVQAVLDDWQSAPIPERLRAGLGLAEALTRRPGEPPHEALSRCEAAGLEQRAIEDLASLAFHFNFINRVADAFDFPMPTDAQRKRLAAVLDRVTSQIRSAPPQSPWAEGPDGILRPVELDQARTHMLECEAVTSPAMRRSAEAHTARALGAGRDAPPVSGPPSLGPYLDKLSRHAYRIVDEDVEALQAAGLTEEAIFEVTVAGAMGAALVGVESLVPLLESNRSKVSASAADPARTMR